MVHKYFTLGEMLYSSKAIELKINNCKTTQIIEANLHALIENILDPAREEFGRPIIVSSGWRCDKLNEAVGGKANSQHRLGQAADLQVASGGQAELKRLFKILSKLPVFDQLLYEHKSNGTFWIHVSYKAEGGNRKYINDNYKA